MQSCGPARASGCVTRCATAEYSPDGSEGSLLAFAEDPRLDFRVAASMAVALDALQSR